MSSQFLAGRHAKAGHGLDLDAGHNWSIPGPIVHSPIVPISFDIPYRRSPPSLSSGRSINLSSGREYSSLLQVSIQPTHTLCMQCIS